MQRLQAEHEREYDKVVEQLKRVQAELDAFKRIPQEVLMEAMLEADDDYRPWPAIHKRIADKITLAVGGKRRRVEQSNEGPANDDE